MVFVIEDFYVFLISDIGVCYFVMVGFLNVGGWGEWLCFVDVVFESGYVVMIGVGDCLLLVLDCKGEGWVVFLVFD